jgi:outer membrane protein assembly factor BamA
MADGAAPVSIAGNQTFVTDQLAEYLEDKGVSLASPAVWRTDERKRASRLLRTYYRDRGFPFVCIELKESQEGFRFLIGEGPRARLRKVRFVGNSALPDSELEKHFGVGEWFNEGQNVGALTRLRGVYRNRGFARASLRQQYLSALDYRDSAIPGLPFFERSRNGVFLEIAISEGPEYRIGRVSCPLELIAGGLALPEQGDLYREHDLVTLQDEIGRYYSQQGSLLKSLRILRNFGHRDARVDLTVLAEIYPDLLVRKIEFSGNEIFPDLFYRRELEIEEGRLLEPIALEKSLQRLGSTGTLTSVTPDDVELDIDEDLQEVYVLLNLREKDRRRIEYSLDPRSACGLTGSVFFSVLNLLGLEETLGLELNYGDQTTGFALGLASRYLIGTDLPISLALGFFKRHTGLSVPGLDDELRALLGVERRGFTGLFAYRLKDGDKAGLSYTIEDVTQLGVTSRHFGFEPFWETAVGLKQCSVRISSPFSFHPGEELAWNYRPSVEASTQFLKSKKGDQSLVLRGRLARGFFFGSQPQFTDRLFFRGLELRGFQQGAGGPWGSWEGSDIPFGSDTIAACSIEYPYRVTKFLKTVPYLDLGWSEAARMPSVIDATNRLVRASTGIEWKLKVTEDLPQVGLGLDWNPLKLDPRVGLETGVAALQDPSFRVRFTLDP